MGSLIQPFSGRLAFLRLIRFQMDLEFRISQAKRLYDLFLRRFNYFDLRDRMKASLLKRLHSAPHLLYRFLDRDSPSIYSNGLWQCKPNGENTSLVLLNLDKADNHANSWGTM